jgi:signal peptidase I
MDGKVYINGYPLDENYTTGVTSYGGIAASQITLDNDEYFVMADNRSNNFDSRDSTVGAIARDDILGKVWLRVFPFEKFGFVK